jgi:hypothetical protein
MTVEYIVDDVVHAVSGVIGTRTLTVTVTVDDHGSLATVRIAGRGGALTVTHLQPQPVKPQPQSWVAEPGPVKADSEVAPPRPEPIRPQPESLDDAAARLAAMIRSDPSLLDPEPW